MEWKRAPNHKGHWKATQVWLMVSFAFLYPYETFFLMLPGWVVKFSRETNGLKYSAETGKGHCLCPHAISVNILWVWPTFTPRKPPPLILSSQRHWSGRCCQTESIVMAESHQVWTEAGQRQHFSLVFYTKFRTIQVFTDWRLCHSTQDCPGPLDLYFVSCTQLKRYIFCLGFTFVSHVTRIHEGFMSKNFRICYQFYTGTWRNAYFLFSFFLLLVKGKTQICAF